jgi:hypothetical protein
MTIERITDEKRPQTPFESLQETPNLDIVDLLHLHMIPKFYLSSEKIKTISEPQNQLMLQWIYDLSRLIMGRNPGVEKVNVSLESSALAFFGLLPPIVADHVDMASKYSQELKLDQPENTLCVSPVNSHRVKIEKSYPLITYDGATLHNMTIERSLVIRKLKSGLMTVKLRGRDGLTESLHHIGRNKKFGDTDKKTANWHDVELTGERLNNIFTILAFRFLNPQDVPSETSSD